MECIHCGKSFESERSTAQFCSSACRVKYNRTQKKHDVTNDPAIKALDVITKPKTKKEKTTSDNTRSIPPPGLDKVGTLRWLREHH